VPAYLPVALHDLADGHVLGRLVLGREIAVVVVEAIVCLLVTHCDCVRINNISKRTRCDEKKKLSKSVEHEMIC